MEFTFIGFITLIVTFIIFREFFCWYWKVNRRIEDQDQQIFVLKAIYGRLGGNLEQLEGELEQRKELIRDRKHNARLNGSNKDES